MHLLAKKCMKRIMGNGQTTKCWRDRWIRNELLIVEVNADIRHTIELEEKSLVILIAPKHSAKRIIFVSILWKNPVNKYL